MIDRYRYIEPIKEITEKLAAIKQDKGFIKEVIYAAETEAELTALHELLCKHPLLVQSEVYDALTEITSGRFQKKMPEARCLKRKYLATNDPADLKELLNYLWNNGLFVLENWNLSPEEKAAFEKAVPGSILQINAPRIPALFESAESESVLIRTYSSEMEIPEILIQNYALTESSLEYVWKVRSLMEKTISRKILLALDYDSDEKCFLKDDMIQEFAGE